MTYSAPFSSASLLRIWKQSNRFLDYLSSEVQITQLFDCKSYCREFCTFAMHFKREEQALAVTPLRLSWLIRHQLLWRHIIATKTIIKIFCLCFLNVKSTSFSLSLIHTHLYTNTYMFIHRVKLGSPMDSSIKK